MTKATVGKRWDKSTAYRLDSLDAARDALRPLGDVQIAY
jgi:hypothetical protein